MGQVRGPSVSGFGRCDRNFIVFRRKGWTAGWLAGFPRPNDAWARVRPNPTKLRGGGLKLWTWRWRCYEYMNRKSGSFIVLVCRKHFLSWYVALLPERCLIRVGDVECWWWCRPSLRCVLVRRRQGGRIQVPYTDRNGMLSPSRCSRSWKCTIQCCDS